MAIKTGVKPVIKKLHQYLKILQGAGIRVDKAYLFGSYAKGNFHPESDIDLALISKEWKPDVIEAQYTLMKLARNIDSRIEPHPFLRVDFNKGNPYASEILGHREGALIKYGVKRTAFSSRQKDGIDFSLYAVRCTPFSI
jgi:uncharacterized protein